jgi:hypothetical protein
MEILWPLGVPAFNSMNISFHPSVRKDFVQETYRVEVDVSLGSHGVYEPYVTISWEERCSQVWAR